MPKRYIPILCTLVFLLFSSYCFASANENDNRMSSSTNDLGNQQTKDEQSNLNEVLTESMPNEEIQDSSVLIQKIYESDPHYKKITNPPKEIISNLSE